MLNQKDSKDLISLEFPELIIKNETLPRIFNHLAMEANRAMVTNPISGAREIFNFTHFLFEHSDKYVQLLLIDQFYKRLSFIHCDLGLSGKTPGVNTAEMQQLPVHVSYRCTTYKNHFQLTRIRFK